MMAENPSFWWSLSGKPPLASQQPSTAFLPVPSSIQMPLPPPSSNFFPPQYIFGTSPVVLPPSSLLHNDHYNQDHFPLSWSHLLMGGLASEEERGGTSSSTDGQFKKLENWEDQILNNPSNSRVPPTISAAVKVKQELDQSRQLIMIYNNNTNHHGGDHDDELQACSSSWSTQAVNNPATSSAACSSTSTSVLDFSTNYKRGNGRNQSSHHSSECNGTSTSGAPAKKARVQPSSSTQPPLKVRKEKLGDRITALHQIVSPFGKTDTASVLLEAIGFIRFLEGQIEALTSPYLGNAASSSSSATTMMQHYPSVKAEMHTEEPDHQLLNGDYQKGRGTAHAKQDEANDHTTTTDLRSRGLCLVPVSCTDHIDLGGNNGSSEYWAPALGGGGCGF